MEYEHTLMTCKCGIDLFLADLVEHKNTECTARLIICRYCHIQVAAGNTSTEPRDLLQTGPLITEHESQCGSRTITCMKCSKSIVIRDVPVHMKHHEMEKTAPSHIKTCRNVLCCRTVDLKNERSLCSICFGPFWNSAVDVGDKKLIQRLTHRLTERSAELLTDWLTQ